MLRRLLRTSLLPRALSALALACAPGGCAAFDDDRVAIVVKVEGLPASTRRLEVLASLDGKLAQNPGQITDHLDQFVVYLPAGTQGLLRVDVGAVVADQPCQSARGQAEVTIGPEARVLNATASLSASGGTLCSLVVTVEGDGQVSVGDGLLPCIGTVCRGLFPLGSTVVLEAQPSPHSRDVQWKQGCQGQGHTCSLVLDESKELVAFFDPLPACASSGFCLHDPRVKSGRLNAVWGSSALDVWVAGKDGAASHFDGGGWTPAPVPPGDPVEFLSVGGAGDGDVLLVGYRPPVNTGDPAPGYVFRYNGDGWQKLFEAPKPLRHLWVASPGVASAVGDGGQLFFPQNDTWTGGSTTTGKVFYGAWGSSTQLWVVGSVGTVGHASFSSSAVTLDALGLATPMRAIWGTGDDDIWAVGDEGMAAHYDGSAWSAPIHISDSHLYGVWGISKTSYWAVGDVGAVRRYNGSTWTSVDAGTTARLSAVWGSADDDVWIVGDGNEGNLVLHLEEKAAP